MSAPTLTENFMTTLRRSHLLSDDQLRIATWRYGLGELDDPQQIAGVLIDHGVLTRYQADRILQGKPRGLVVGQYKVQQILGSGGMGIVYLAEDTQSNWKAALKVLFEKHRKNPAMFARFQLEAQAGLRLTHPNILRTLEINRTEDIYGEIHYMAMEFVQGITLVELLHLRRGIPWRQACDIICQAAEGLQYAHDQGLIHRDVKPDNLLIRSNGAVKVLDFGLAMLDENGEEFSMAMIHGQNCLGTADYIAPEQSLDSYRIDARADIYSLGCTLYALLVGRVPFSAPSNAEKVDCHRRKRARPVREFRLDVPERVELIVRKMMAKKPENRFASASEVIRYLQPFANRESVEFDFDAVLAARAAEAQRRLTTQDMTQIGSDSTQARVVSAATDPRPHASADTRIRKDTRSN